MNDASLSGDPAPKVRPTHDGTLLSELVVVGSDLLSGVVGDSSAQLVATALAERGAPVRRITVIADDAEIIEATLREVLDRNPNIVVTIGGLGPARDDRTMTGVSRALELPLKLNPGARECVESAYRRMREDRRVESTGLNAAREKMAYLPVGCIVLDNVLGIAPGSIYRLPGGTAVISVPGTPREARTVFEAALPHLGDLGKGSVRARREIEAPLPDESALRPLIERMVEEFPNAKLTTRPVGSQKKGYRLVVLIEVPAETTEEAESAIGAIVKRLLDLVSGLR
jgi:nicotinamide-nucleotide amidase